MFPTKKHENNYILEFVLFLLHVADTGVVINHAKNIMIDIYESYEPCMQDKDKICYSPTKY